jgi:hypothetical protein
MRRRWSGSASRPLAVNLLEAVMSFIDGSKII